MLQMSRRPVPKGRGADRMSRQPVPKGRGADGKKKVLMLASVASMIDQFNMPNIRLLLGQGYQVDVACNFLEGSTCSQAKIAQLKKELASMGVRRFQVDFTRKAMDFGQDYKAYRQVKRLCEKNRYAWIHCHSPIGGVVGRIAGHRTNTKVIYTAHGFHFYQGAPLLNWLMYYPVEKMLSYWTDTLVTVNHEDYQRARNKFHARHTAYIPGVGVDIWKFADCRTGRKDKRRELGIPDDAFVLLSVGELQRHKNHKIVIESLHRNAWPDIWYLIAGKGKLEQEYRSLMKRWGLEKRVKLLGFRTDIAELCRAADCFVHPSVREGFGIAPMEAMASGLPLISADIGGIRDYTQDGKTGCCVNPVSAEEISAAIGKMYEDEDFRKRCGQYNAGVAKKYDIQRINGRMQGIYEKIGRLDGNAAENI